MKVIVLDFANGAVAVHNGVPEGKEEEYVCSLYKESNVSYMSIADDAFVIRSYNYSDVIKYVN